MRLLADIVIYAMLFVAAMVLLLGLFAVGGRGDNDDCR